MPLPVLAALILWLGTHHIMLALCAFRKLQQLCSEGTELSCLSRPEMVGDCLCVFLLWFIVSVYTIEVSLV